MADVNKHTPKTIGGRMSVVDDTEMQRLKKMGHYGSDGGNRGKVLLERQSIISSTRKELLADLTFSKGFAVTGFHSNSSGGKSVGYLTYDGLKASGNPDWKLAQWGCRKDIVSEHTFRRENGVMTYTDGGKYLRVNTDAVGCIELGIKGSVEYTLDSAGRPRERLKATENWPHILIEQAIETKLSRDCRRLCMEIDYQVEECNSLVDRRNYPVNPDMHAGQFQWFLMLQDGDEHSKSYGQNMWFGFSMFDTRTMDGTPSGFQAYDGGKEDATGFFIYMPSLKDLAKTEGNRVESIPTTVIGKRICIKVDILPEIEKALKIVQGYGVMQGANVGKMKVLSTNLGWELPGNYDVRAKIHYLNIYEEY